MARSTINLQQLQEHQGRKELVADLQDDIASIENEILNCSLSEPHLNDKNYTRHDVMREKRKILLYFIGAPELIINRIRSENRLQHNEEEPI